MSNFHLRRVRACSLRSKCADTALLPTGRLRRGAVSTAGSALPTRDSTPASALWTVAGVRVSRGPRRT